MAVDFNVYYKGKIYVGTPLIMKGSRECPRCKGTMIKVPVGIPYVDKGIGYYPVDISQTSGRMTLNKKEVETIWVCQDNCSRNRK